MEKFIDFLMEYGGDSIQYRIRRDILNAPLQTEEMRKLHERILCNRK